MQFDTPRRDKIFDLLFERFRPRIEKYGFDDNGFDELVDTFDLLGMTENMVIDVLNNDQFLEAVVKDENEHKKKILGSCAGDEYLDEIVEDAKGLYFWDALTMFRHLLCRIDYKYGEFWKEKEEIKVAKIIGDYHPVRGSDLPYWEYYFTVEKLREYYEQLLKDATKDSKNLYASFIKRMLNHEMLNFNDLTYEDLYTLSVEEDLIDAHVAFMFNTTKKHVSARRAEYKINRMWFYG